MTITGVDDKNWFKGYENLVREKKDKNENLAMVFPKQIVKMEFDDNNQ